MSESFPDDFYKNHDAMREQPPIGDQLRDTSSILAVLIPKIADLIDLAPSKELEDTDRHCVDMEFSPSDYPNSILPESFRRSLRQLSNIRITSVADGTYPATTSYELNDEDAIFYMSRDPLATENPPEDQFVPNDGAPIPFERVPDEELSALLLGLARRPLDTMMPTADYMKNRFEASDLIDSLMKNAKTIRHDYDFETPLGNTIILSLVQEDGFQKLEKFALFYMTDDDRQVGVEIDPSAGFGLSFRTENSSDSYFEPTPEDYARLDAIIEAEISRLRTAI